MDDLLTPLWPPPWVEDHTLSDEQLLAAGDDVKLMTAVRSDERVLLSVSWPGGRRYMMIDPEGGAPPEALRAGAVAADPTIAGATLVRCPAASSSSARRVPSAPRPSTSCRAPTSSSSSASARSAPGRRSSTRRTPTACAGSR